MKKCSMCQQLKNDDEFYKKKSGLLCSSCKECTIKRSIGYRKNNREKVNANARKRYIKNPDKFKMSSYKWQTSHPKSVKAIKQKYNSLHSEGARARNKKYRLNNIDRARECEKKLRAKDREGIKRRRDRARSTPNGKLNNSISTAIRMSLKGNKSGRHWETLVGYTLFDLKEHLEKLFTYGMDWSNQGLWHIDHKIPLAVHNFKTPNDIDFKKCWALGNLQPMWAIDNLIKGERIDKPFQPALSMSLGG